MTELPENESPEFEARRRKVIAQRNVVTALVLVGFVVLFFFITVAKFGN